MKALLAILLLGLTPGFAGAQEAWGFVFRDRVAMCWDVAGLNRAALATSVKVRFELNPDGTPKYGTLRLVSYEGGDADAAEQAYQAAATAILLCGENGGYDLPVEQYEGWRIVEMNFDPARMVGIK